MKSRYLLDTNILSDLVKYPQGRVAYKIQQVDEKAVCTSVVVVVELRFRTAKLDSEKLTNQVEAILRAMEVLPFEKPEDQQYAQHRLNSKKTGMLIRPNDLWIVAQSLTVNCVIVTANVREFKRVSGLRIENWLATD